MNKYLKQLVELNQYDKKLENLIPIEENIKKPLTTLQTKVKNLTTKLEKLTDDIKNLVLKKSKNELLITELKEKLEQIAQKSAKVKTYNFISSRDFSFSSSSCCSLEATKPYKRYFIIFCYSFHYNEH
jgi:predicted  nucleic acid-binding Zn-ribbon protein